MSGTTSKPADTRYCDAVMKGGITSGVVYPRALFELARKFRFKNLGGASAGAIAAAGAAAAERGRSMGREGAFRQLEELPEFLGSKSPDGSTRLFSLFQPQELTAPLFRVCIAALGGGSSAILRVIAAACRNFPIASALGAAPGVWIAYVARQHDSWATALTIFVALIVFGVGVAGTVAVAILHRIASALPANHFGLCSGMPGVGGKPAESLTPWLFRFYNELAGLEDGAPLTFGHLQGAEDPIHLEMMTTCLTQGRPYRLPFREDEDVREGRLFYFSKTEFESLFPEAVVRWMLDHPRPDEGAESHKRRETFAKQGLYPLPTADDFPVVVAVRMSLSFPILLSAIPLWAVDYSRTTGNHMPERCWFSDGGICSNFPVHFFDAPLPRWPTFGITLDPKHPDHQPGFWMPKTNGQGVLSSWDRFDSTPGLAAVGGFLSRILDTMLGWSDATQSQLPGFRDRIAHIVLDAHDGGLNLNMSPEKIHRLSDYGRAAGAELRERFAGTPQDCELDWENHRWIRLRASLTALEDLLHKVDLGCATIGPGDGGYEEWIRSGRKPPSYPWSRAEQGHLAAQTLAALREAFAGVRQYESKYGGEGLVTNSPRPHPELRTRPRI